LALFDQMQKRDWALVAASIAGALLFGVWSFQMGVAYHRLQHGATDLSSSKRHGGDASSVTAPASPRTDDADVQTRLRR
jgi:hypothetical protein